jgi:hypothetical protein
MTPADHIARAKSEALNGDAKYAIAHAAIAIAELLLASTRPPGPRMPPPPIGWDGTR